jgi:hypothetical protein
VVAKLETRFEADVHPSVPMPHVIENMLSEHRILAFEIQFTHRTMSRAG